MEAARKTVERCTKKRKEELANVAKNHPKAQIIPMSSPTSKNCLPLALAEAIGLPIWNMVIQDKKYGHTEMTRDERLFDKPNFVGEIQKGKEYVITDDVMTSGSSIKALINFIEQKGGKVVDVVVLSSRWGKSLTPNEEQIEAFEKAFDEEQRENIYRMMQINGAEDLTSVQLTHLRGMKYSRLLKAYENYKNSQNKS